MFFTRKTHQHITNTFNSQLTIFNNQLTFYRPDVPMGHNTAKPKLSIFNSQLSTVN